MKRITEWVTNQGNQKVKVEIDRTCPEQSDTDVLLQCK